MQAALDATPPPTRGAHRRPHVWKRWFVWRVMGHLWLDLTAVRPGKSPGTLFAKFVEAGWKSLGDQMPDVNFENAIKDGPNAHLV
jgi:hypothetical protein